MTRRSGPGSAERGFVLVATVWVLAALVLLADYVDSVVSADRQRARLAKEALQDDLDARGTEATLLYLLTTGRRSHRGLLLETAGEPNQDISSQASGAVAPPANMIALSGEPYAGLGRMRFSLQDEAGLASVNKPGPVYRAVLRHAGVADSDMAGLLPRLRDYIDRDETLVVSGAERADYAKAGLPPPANWFLAAPLELKKVLGARAVVPPERWAVLRRTTTAALTVAVNFNTMSLEMLTAFLGGDEAAAQRVAAYREQRVLTDVDAVSKAAGVDLSAYGNFPSGTVVSRLRIALWRDGDAQRTVVGVALTPNAIDAPWRKEYRYLEPAVAGSELARKPKTPLFQPT